MSKTADQWLAEYAASHRNSTNQRIHTVCVPLIAFSLVALLWPPRLFEIRLAYWFFALAVLFYLRLGMKAFLIATAQFVVFFLILSVWPESIPLVPVALGIFVLAWIGQFVGHKIEGQRPSFLQDLQFLLIGPLWVFSHPTRATIWRPKGPRKSGSRPSA